LPRWHEKYTRLIKEQFKPGDPPQLQRESGLRPGNYYHKPSISKIEPGAQAKPAGIVEEEDTPSTLAADDAPTLGAQVLQETASDKEERKKRKRAERELVRLQTAAKAPVEKGHSCPSCQGRVGSVGAHACFVCQRVMHGLAACGEHVPGECEMARICIPCVSKRDGQGNDTE
jgi:hypothetical protein